MKGFQRGRKRSKMCNGRFFLALKELMLLE